MQESLPIVGVATARPFASAAAVWRKLPRDRAVRPQDALTASDHSDDRIARELLDVPQQFLIDVRLAQERVDAE